MGKITDKYIHEMIDRYCKDDLARKNTIIIPHGSLVEYLGTSKFTTIKLPTFGNRKVLKWESDRRIGGRCPIGVESTVLSLAE